MSYEEGKFRNRKILLFAPQFFGYGVAIADKLRQLGATVDIFDERPGNDFLTKGLIRINKRLLARKSEAYYNQLMQSYRPDYYDFVVFLNPEAIPEKNLERLRGQQQSARFIMYMWDSIRNKKHTHKLLPYFHQKFTFDKRDSEEEDFGLRFRPLFFLDDFTNIRNQPAVIDNDLLFVGTIHSDRYDMLMKIQAKCESLRLSTDFFMYLPNKKLFYINKVINRNFKDSKLHEFSFKAMPRQDMLEKVKRSKVVLDVQHPKQEGLTMRTIEMIGAGKKLLTTNREILNYDFYDANNIQYIDRNEPLIDKAFFESDYRPIDPGIYMKYSIQGWLGEVFYPHPSEN